MQISTAARGLAGLYAAGMDLRLVDQAGVHVRPVEDLPGLLATGEGFLWADVPARDEEAERALVPLVTTHRLVVDTFGRRNHTPTVHVYDEQRLLVVHTPLLGGSGHVHLIELDLLVGERFLLTVHGPVNPEVDPASTRVETGAVLQRLEAGRLEARTPNELAHAVLTAVARGQRELVSAVAERLPDMERRVMAGDFRNPEDLLEELFLLRHELLVGRTMSAQTHEVLGRLAGMSRRVDPETKELATDLADQFDRIRAVADGEAQFLFGVIELYQTRVTTKMTVAMERLAVIAAVTLPVTAIASVYGMNVIVNRATHWVQLTIVLALMLSISLLLLRWARRQGWW